MSSPIPTLDAVALDTSGLRMESDSPTERCWLNEAGEPTSLHLSRQAPYFPASLDLSEPLRTWYRQLALGAELGMVDFDLVRVDRIPSIRLVLKGVLDPDTGLGRGYVGTLTVPFRDFCYIIKVKYREWGITGAREAAVLSQRGELEDWFDGWITDPSDPAPRHLARNLSEDPQYDSIFPNHPLSRMRVSLDALQGSARIAEDVRALPLFGASPPTRPWWKVW